ncbi:MAG: twin-arginine translocase TatA/TatE family subunit [Chloroflexi bacterium]|nr:twin-arginine translocase TatA/TatE family subunit [Chloroflexota bacterium]
MNFFGMGPLEILFVLGLGLVVFGPEKLPELSRQVGRMFGEIRRLSSEATSGLQHTLSLDGPGVARPRRPITPPSGRAADEPVGKIGGPEAPLPPY